MKFSENPGISKIPEPGKIGIKDGGLSVFSGFLLTASFAPVDHEWLAWISLMPLFACLRGKSISQSFKLGVLFGLSHYLSLVYWVIVVLSHYGNLDFMVSLAVLFLLCLYLAMYHGIFSLIISGRDTSDFPAFLVACAWVALEYVRAHFISGFPWCLLGYTQYSRPMIIQVADITGVYGISFVIVLVNTAIYNLFSGAGRHRKTKPAELILVLFLVSFILVYGYLDINAGSPAGKAEGKANVAIVQGNIDQSIKWNKDYQEKTLSVYKRLSVKLKDAGPEIIIWPETALPFFFQDKSYLSGEVAKISKITNSKILFGAPAYLRENQGVSYYNRAYLIYKGKVLDYYDKVHLVPFGEYAPLKRILPFVDRLVPAVGDFSPGEEIGPLNSNGLSIGTLICFEAIFPEISRKHVSGGAGFLVNITNDAWFGHTSAPYQHLSMAVFRCVENELSMARAANTGISAFIGPDGKIIKSCGLYERNTIKSKIKLSTERTFYSQFGDVFVIIAFAILVIWIFRTAIIKGR